MSDATPEPLPEEVQAEVDALTEEITETQEPSPEPPPATDEVAEAVQPPAPVEVTPTEDPPPLDAVTAVVEGNPAEATPGEDEVSRTSKAEQAARSESEVGGTDASQTSAGALEVVNYSCAQCNWGTFDAENGEELLRLKRKACTLC